MTRRLLPAIVLAAVVLFAAEASATPKIATNGAEELRYSWQLRGGLAWIASLRFPTSGHGHLTTVRNGASTIETELKITGNGTNDFYLYQSQIDETSLKTLMTYHGYAWGEKKRHERTLFDYVKRLARIRKETPEKVTNRVKQLPSDQMRDVLTGIFFLRNRALGLTGPLKSEIYSDGKLYPILYKPEGRETLTVQGKRVSTRTYRIVAAPGADKKWPGGIRVWLTDDDTRTPVRIEMHRNLATLRLDLVSM